MKLTTKLHRYMFFGLRKVNSFLRYRSDTPSSIPVTVVGIVHPKDAGMLPLWVEGARKNILHPVREIVIVSPNNEKIQQTCRALNIRWLDENSVLPGIRRKITITVNSIDRSGWLFQQFLKLSMEKFVSTEHYVIIDADTILLQPTTFIQNSKYLLEYSGEYHQPYYDVFERLFGFSVPFPVSVVTHKMIFSKKVLKIMKKFLYKKHQQNWMQTVLEVIDRREVSFFCDYDVYGYFLDTLFPDKIHLKFWNNISVASSRRSSLSEEIKKYQARYASVSLHIHIPE